MADDSIFHYLPPGWTEEQFQNATEDEWKALPEEERRKFIDRSAAESRRNIANNLAEINASRASRGAPPVELRQSEEEDLAIDTDEAQSPLSGIHALAKILEQESWDKFGFVVFRTYYRNEGLWDQFLDRWDAVLQEELKSSNDADVDKEKILSKVDMQIVSDDCMENKIPAHVAMAFRMFNDIGPGLKTKMCLIVDEECMRSTGPEDPKSESFVKAVDVSLGVDAESAFPGTIRVAISSLLAGFYPALVNCDSVWEIAPKADQIWKDWPGSEDTELG